MVEKTNLYILAILSIVAVVGIVVMLIDGKDAREGLSSVNLGSDQVGFATASATCTDTDSGFDYTTKGTISGGTWKTTGRTYSSKTDSCNARGQLQEGFCSDSTHGFYVFKYCDRVLGAGYVCEDGACVPESCTENLYLGESLTECEPTVESTSTFVLSQDDADAPVADMYLFVDYASGDEVYLAEGDTYDEFTVDSIENDDYDTIQLSQGWTFWGTTYTSTGTLVQIEFYNGDDREVMLPLFADPDATAGEADDEAIYWGASSYTSGTGAQIATELYLEGETCQGDTTIDDCVRALFLVVENGNAHLIQITDVDTRTNDISLTDLTYEVDNDEEPYTDGSETTIELTEAGEITLVVDESANTIEFRSIGSSDGATITTLSGAALEIVNTDTSTQVFEGLLFSEYDDGVVDTYLTDFEITAAFDDATDNSIELDRTPVRALTSSDGYGLYDVSDTNDDDQVFMTYKGTLLTYDIEDQLSMTIEHPENSVYAVVSVD